MRTVYKSDVFNYLEKNKKQYDVVFADPPYDLKQEDFEKIIFLVFEYNAISEDGILIIEHAKYTNLSHLKNFSYQKNYGGCIFSFFEKN
jgi:16S rRNA G966 N2-methylase RsmD